MCSFVTLFGVKSTLTSCGAVVSAVVLVTARVVGVPEGYGEYPYPGTL
jgi:hypothetical protein